MTTIYDALSAEQRDALLGARSSHTTPAVPDWEAWAVAQDRTPAIRKPSTAKHRARTSASPAEIAAATLAAITKEHDMPAKINLSTLSDAELGRMVRSGLLVLAVDKAPANRTQAQQVAAEVATEQRDLLLAERAERASETLTAFTMHKVEVPALDLDTVTAHAVAPAKARSPYNKVRNRSGLALLPTDTTWADLAREHNALALVAQQAEAAPAKVEPKVAAPKAAPAKKARITAAFDPAAKAKYDALLAVGIPEAQALKLVRA